MGIVIAIAAFVFSLGVLVIIHEGGHFLAALSVGVKVLRFSVGFGPVLWKHTSRRGTEFVVSALPLGGYVKMLDSRDPECADECMKHPGGDFENKRLWQRAWVVFAGPLMNFVLAVLIFWIAGMAGTYELSSRVAAPAPGTAAAEAGVRHGDYVVQVGDMDVSTFRELQMKLLRVTDTLTTVTVAPRRDAGEGELRRYALDLRGIAFDQDPAQADPMGRAGFAPWQGPVTVQEVIAGGAAEKAGLRKGDTILEADGVPVAGSMDFLRAVRSGAGRELAVTVDRGGARHTLRLTVAERRDESTGKPVGRIGVRIGGLPEVVFVRLGPWDALVKGSARLWDTATLSLRVLGRMLIGEASVKNLSGPVAIADYAGQAAQVGLHSFLYFIAMMSISLGVLNLLPVPVLDGGHLALYAYEAVARRKPSPGALALIQRVGLSLILFITLIALANDISRLFGG